MKAINRGGVITTYPSAPSQFEGNIKHYFSGFNLLSEAQQKAEGLFNVVIPEYNSIVSFLKQTGLILEKQTKVQRYHQQYKVKEMRLGFQLIQKKMKYKR